MRADAAQLIEIVAIDLRHQRTVRAADHVIDTVDDGLADADGIARQVLGEARRQFVDKLFLRFTGRPGVVRLQPDRRLDVGHGPRIRAVIVAAGLGDHIGNFGVLEYCPAQFARHVAGLVQRQARRHLHLQPQCAFVQIRQEVPADCGPQADHREQREYHHAINDPRLLEAGGEDSVIRDGQAFQPAIVINPAGLAECQICKTRNQRQRRQQGAEQCIAHGIGHRCKQLRLGPFEREQRQIGGNDDQAREENWARHLQRRSLGFALAQFFVRHRFAPPQHGLGHDDGSVDQDAEIDGPQRQ